MLSPINLCTWSLRSSGRLSRGLGRDQIETREAFGIGSRSDFALTVVCGFQVPADETSMLALPGRPGRFANRIQPSGACSLGHADAIGSDLLE
jgi:hypothetical protein